jgi:hypothetical protein
MDMEPKTYSFHVKLVDGFVRNAGPDKSWYVHR